MSSFNSILTKFKSLDLKLVEIKIKRAYKETHESNCLYELAIINILKNCGSMAILYARKGKKCSKNEDKYNELLTQISELNRYQRT